jgi:hypothetical protein
MMPNGTMEIAMNRRISLNWSRMVYHLEMRYLIVVAGAAARSMVSDTPLGLARK